jgi:hypothetical protein
LKHGNDDDESELMMRQKPDPAKKKTAAAAGRAAPSAPRSQSKPRSKDRPRASTPKSLFYVATPVQMALVSIEKPAADVPAQSFATFDAARHAAIDSLVEAIEDAERRLLRLRRAARFEDIH